MRLAGGQGNMGGLGEGDGGARIMVGDRLLSEMGRRQDAAKEG